MPDRKVDEVVTAWQEAQAAATKAREDYKTRTTGLVYGRRRDTPTEANLIDAECAVALLEADAAAAAAAHVATGVVDAAELAAGDELAVTRDPATLHRDLLDLDEEERALEEALLSARNRKLERVARAIQAEDALVQRRAAANLPPPVRLPQRAMTVIDGVRPITITQALATLLAAPPAPPTFAQAIADGHRQVIVIAARLEELRRDEERDKEYEATIRHNKQVEIRELNDRMARRAADRDREKQEVEQRRHEAATAYLARRSGAKP